MHIKTHQPPHRHAQALPDTVLICIFKHLPFWERFNSVDLVNKRWYGIARLAVELWHTVELDGDEEVCPVCFSYVFFHPLTTSATG